MELKENGADNGDFKETALLKNESKYKETPPGCCRWEFKKKNKTKKKSYVVWLSATSIVIFFEYVSLNISVSSLLCEVHGAIRCW